MDNLLDPTTGDYTGSRTDTLANAIYLRLTIPLGSWWAKPKVGSKLYLLKREKDLSRVRLLAKQYAEEALAPLLLPSDGRAKSISVTATQGAPGWLTLLIVVEAANAEPREFNYPVRVV